MINISQEKLDKILTAHPSLKEYADFEITDNGLVIKLTSDFKDFDIAFEDYFYLKNNPEDPDAVLIDQIYEHIYNLVASLCAANGLYQVDNWKGRLTVRRIDEKDAAHYASLSADEKKEKDLSDKKNAIYNEIYEAKAYLDETDYIITKFSELVAEGLDEELTELKQQYAESLTKRKKARAKINELENQLAGLEVKNENI